MSGGKHTLGQWKISPTNSTVVIAVGRNGIWCEVAAIEGDYNNPREWPIMEANARLIAAAPSLLAALPDLSHVIDWLRKGCNPAEAVHELEIYQAKINVARAKAKKGAE